MTRAYFRGLPDLYVRKAFGTGPKLLPPRHSAKVHPPYPPAAIAAYVGVLCLGEQQPQRGRFSSRGVLVESLKGGEGHGRPMARQVDFLITQGDLIAQVDGSLYIDGWDELQEGDWQVAERMQRYRGRKLVTPATVTPVTPPTVTSVTPAHVTRLSLREELDSKESGGNGGSGGNARATETDDADPAFPARQWLSAHSAPVRDGDGYHRKLVQLVATDGGKTCADVVRAFEQLRAEGARTSKQYVMGAEDLLFPTLKPHANGKAPATDNHKYDHLVESDDDLTERPDATDTDYIGGTR
jgi:hypothetical protein